MKLILTLFISLCLAACTKCDDKKAPTSTSSETNNKGHSKEASGLGSANEESTSASSDKQASENSTTVEEFKKREYMACKCECVLEDKTKICNNFKKTKTDSGFNYECDLVFPYYRMLTECKDLESHNVFAKCRGFHPETKAGGTLGALANCTTDDRPKEEERKDNNGDEDDNRKQ